MVFVTDFLLSDPAIPTVTMKSKSEIQLKICKLFPISITSKHAQYCESQRKFDKRIVGLERIRGFNNIINFSIHF